MNEAYIATEIEYEYRHNIILSLKYGTFTYNNQFFRFTYRYSKESEDVHAKSI